MRRGAFWGTWVLLLVGCGARSPIDEGGDAAAWDGGQPGGGGAHAGAGGKGHGGGPSGTSPITGGTGGSQSLVVGTNLTKLEALCGVAATTLPVVAATHQHHFLIEATTTASAKHTIVVTLDASNRLTSWDATAALPNCRLTELSPNGRYARLHSTTVEGAFLWDFDRHSVLELASVAKDCDGVVARTHWIDESRILTTCVPKGGTPSRRIVRIDPSSSVLTAGSALAAPVDDCVVISKDGSWYSSATVEGAEFSVLFSYELRPVRELELGAIVASASATGQGMDAFFAPDGESLTFMYSHPTTGERTVRTLELGAEPVVEHIAFYQTGPAIANYSRGSNYLYLAQPYYEPSRNSLVTTWLNWKLGQWRHIPLPGGLEFTSAISPLDDYYLLNGAQQVGYVSLRDAQGNDTVEPGYVPLVEHSWKAKLRKVQLAESGLAMIYQYANFETGYYGLYWVELGSPVGTGTYPIEILGSKRGVDFSLSPNSDWVAVPTENANTLYLIAPQRVPTMQTFELLPHDDTVRNAYYVEWQPNFRLVWAPDDSGLFVLRNGQSGSVHFLPRQSDRAAGFGEPSYLPLALSELATVEPILPDQWN